MSLGTWTLDARACDDGVAFRYIVPGREDVGRIPDEATTFRVPMTKDLLGIDVPPLRDRGHVDLDRLVDHFLYEFVRRHGRRSIVLSPEARKALFDAAKPAVDKTLTEFEKGGVPDIRAAYVAMNN